MRARSHVAICVNIHIVPFESCSLIINYDSMLASIYPYAFSTLSTQWDNPTTEEQERYGSICICGNHCVEMLTVLPPGLNPNNRDHMKLLKFCHICAEDVIKYTNFKTIPPCTFWEFVQRLEFGNDESNLCNDICVYMPWQYRPGYTITKDRNYNTFIGIRPCYGSCEYLMSICNRSVYIEYDYNDAPPIEVDGCIINMFLIDIGYTLSKERVCKTSNMFGLYKDTVRMILLHAVLQLFPDHNDMVRIQWLKTMMCVI
jgi:hypothetical protein